MNDIVYAVVRVWIWYYESRNEDIIFVCPTRGMAESYIRQHSGPDEVYETDSECQYWRIAEVPQISTLADPRLSPPAPETYQWDKEDEDDDEDDDN